MPGTLYMVGTPIGNLGDFSPRGQEILKKVDFIAAEDTRVTVKLLNHFDIQKPLLSYHAHNFKTRGEELITRLQDGENGALCSDAGMPCISDPGADMVRLCEQRGIAVQVVPGPTALITALCASGLNTSRFCFVGFLSTNRNNRIADLQRLRQYPETLIFYEAPHKLCATLEDLLSVLGDRPVAVGKEFTKLHETVFRTTLGKAGAHFEGASPKGEFVLVVAGASEEDAPKLSLNQAIAYAKEQMANGVRVTEAAKDAAGASGIAKSLIYKHLC